MSTDGEREEAAAKGHGVYGGTGRDDGRLQEEPDAADEVDEAWADKTETGGDAS